MNMGYLNDKLLNELNTFRVLSDIMTTQTSALGNIT